VRLRIAERWRGKRDAQPEERTARSAVPTGESWRQAVERGGWFLRDVATRYDDERILLIGHVATKWALDHYLRGVPLEDLVHARFEWQEGWSYDLSREILDAHV
jgi:broad specificity phosphatase PhoE